MEGKENEMKQKARHTLTIHRLDPSEGFRLVAEAPCVFTPASMSGTRPVTTDATSPSSFDQTLAHSILHMSTG